MSAAWIVACLVAIVALYVLLLSTAHALHVAEQAEERRAVAEVERQGIPVDQEGVAAGHRRPDGR